MNIDFTTDENARKEAIEILRYCEVLEGVDDDVADMVLKILPSNPEPISLAELTKGVQGLKDKWRKEWESEVRR